MAAKRPSFLTNWFFLAVLYSVPVLWQHKYDLVAPLALSFVVAIGFTLNYKYHPNEIDEINTKQKLLKSFLGFWGLYFLSFANQLFRFHWIPLGKLQLPSATGVVMYTIVVTILAAVTTFLVWNALREKRTFITLFVSDRQTASSEPSAERASQ
ncbi:MAG TPA: hypothetical protein VFB76_15860 [Candidatus Angelobacter sp.]|nr:hypothetical protein [Candidatus Angelobacter sp.]